MNLCMHDMICWHEWDNLLQVMNMNISLLMNTGYGWGKGKIKYMLVWPMFLHKYAWWILNLTKAWLNVHFEHILRIFMHGFYTWYNFCVKPYYLHFFYKCSFRSLWYTSLFKKSLGWLFSMLGDSSWSKDKILFISSSFVLSIFKTMILRATSLGLYSIL